MPADLRLLGVALAAGRQLLLLAEIDLALDDLLDDPLGHLCARAAAALLGDQRLDGLVGLLRLVLDQGGVQRLRELEPSR